VTTAPTAPGRRSRSSRVRAAASKGVVDLSVRRASTAPQAAQHRFVAGSPKAPPCPPVGSKIASCHAFS
jgi:hypothetical protein